MKSQFLCLAASILCLASGPASAQTLTVGDDAPALEVSRWVKGEKIDRLEKDRTYVVEFWATWCGPCKTSIPHLTELQKKYKDKGIRFIGVSVSERDQDKVEPFVKEMGDKMDYAVALDLIPKGGDAEDGKMNKNWMEAAGQEGIPTAFIVRGGKLAWIGHPMSMDAPLARVASPDFDISKAIIAYREEQAKESKLSVTFDLLRKLSRDGTNKERLAIIDKAIATYPELEPDLGIPKYAFMLQEDTVAASAYATKMIEGALKDDAEGLNQVAWFNVDPDSDIAPEKRDFKLALKAATRANELSKGENGAILDTLALCYFKTGEPAKALEAQEKAIKLMGDGDEGMKDRLEQYRKAVAEKKP